MKITKQQNVCDGGDDGETVFMSLKRSRGTWVSHGIGAIFGQRHAADPHDRPRHSDRIPLFQAHPESHDSVPHG